MDRGVLLTPQNFGTEEINMLFNFWWNSLYLTPNSKIHLPIAPKDPQLSCLSLLVKLKNHTTSCIVTEVSCTDLEPVDLLNNVLT